MSVPVPLRLPYKHVFGSWHPTVRREKFKKAYFMTLFAVQMVGLLAGTIWAFSAHPLPEAGLRTAAAVGGWLLLSRWTMRLALELQGSIRLLVAAADCTTLTLAMGLSSLPLLLLGLIG